MKRRAQLFLKSIQEKKEYPREAKLFDIGDAIRKKRQKDSSHPYWLTMKEVIEAIDEAGYRPATLEELLAYGRDYWEPDAHPNTQTHVQKLFQFSNVRGIFAIGSVFSSSDGFRYVPCLYWNDDRRQLDANGFDLGWYSDNRFLVFPKESL